MTEQAQSLLMQYIENKPAPTLNKSLSLIVQVFKDLVEGNPRADRALPGPDLLSVYPPGSANRDDHVGRFADAPTMAQFELFGIKLRVQALDVVLLTYRADYVRSDGKKGELMLISFLSKRCHDVWINCFSRDTPLDST